MKREPYPLQWPGGWPRATIRHGRGTSRYEAKFEGKFARDRDAVIRQLKKRGSHVVITSDLPTRSDGLPYADATARDPGIAVYWVERGQERVIACDRWKTHALNLRAIDLSLEALRGLDRWGASEMVERAFAGFAALPPGSGQEYVALPPGSGQEYVVALPPGSGQEYVAQPPPRKRTWRAVLGPAINGAPLMPWPDLSNDELLAVAKSRHRRLIALYHPDAGGAHEVAAELNAALADAERELGGD